MNATEANAKAKSKNKEFTPLQYKRIMAAIEKAANDGRFSCHISESLFLKIKNYLVGLDTPLTV